MCTKPQTLWNEAAGKEVTVSCRKCDACVAVRRHNWVARAMGDKACHPFAFVVALTYSDETQFTRDGARFFRYDDVRLFLARLRDAIKQATGKVAALRFIAAGEQGSRNGRCHWHVVLFSDVDLITIGKWRAPWGEVTKHEEIIAPVGVDMPRGWTMWPHGFVQVQVPDEGGMHYALSYALKDQFNSMNARDSKRISKAEAFATGLFRMSKAPPIGAAFVDRLIYEAYERGFVYPDLKLQVPDFRGYWYPSGILRKRFLIGMRRVNASLVAQYGRNAGQWRTLVYNVRENEGDLEALGMSPVEDEDEETIGHKIARKQRESAAAIKTKEIVAQCGGELPCIQCLRGFPDDTLAQYGLAFQDGQLVDVKTNLPPKTRGGKSSGINPGCQLRETQSRKRAFPHSAVKDFD